MYRVAFKGFHPGTSVTIGGVTVNAWGQVEGGGTVWDQPADPGVSVSINVNRSAFKVAPEAMFFSVDLDGFETNTAAAIDVYDPSYHDKVYFWDYGEEYSFSAPTKVLEMDAADGGSRGNSRYSMGPLGSHVFRSAATHLVRLAVLEPSSGKWGQATFNATVGDPDQFFSGAATLFVDTSGAFDNAPSGARTFTSLPAAWSVLKTALTPHRIVLERGQTHVITSVLDYRVGSGTTAASMRIEARKGSGARPLIQEGSGYTDEGMIQDYSRRNVTGIPAVSVVQGIELRGTWDVLTESGNWNTRGIVNSFHGADNMTVDDCVMSNMNMGLWSFAVDPVRNSRVLALNDSAISNWSNYGFFESECCHTAIIGTRIAQNPQAITGGATNQGGYNSHGPFRSANPNKTAIISSDFFSSTGWSAVGAFKAAQPAIRWNTAVTLGAGAQLNIQSSAFESARTAANLSTANNSFTPRQVNGVVEGSIFLAGFLARSAMELTHGGLTFRNSIVSFADTQYEVTPTAFFGARSSGDLSDAQNDATPLRFYNNLLVNHASTGDPAVWDGSNMNFSDVLETHNVIHQPARGDTPFAPLAAVQGFSPRYAGYVPEGGGTQQTARAHGAMSAALYIPQPGSEALGAALSDPNASTDFRGSLRPEPPSAGPFEVEGS